MGLYSLILTTQPKPTVICNPQPGKNLWKKQRLSNINHWINKGVSQFSRLNYPPIHNLLGRIVHSKTCFLALVDFVLGSKKEFWLDILKWIDATTALVNATTAPIHLVPNIEFSWILTTQQKCYNRNFHLTHCFSTPKKFHSFKETFPTPKTYNATNRRPFSDLGCRALGPSGLLTLSP